MPYSTTPSAISTLVPIYHTTGVTSREIVMFKDRTKEGEKGKKWIIIRLDRFKIITNTVGLISGKYAAIEVGNGIPRS